MNKSGTLTAKPPLFLTGRATPLQNKLTIIGKRQQRIPCEGSLQLPSIKITKPMFHIPRKEPPLYLPLISLMKFLIENKPKMKEVADQS